jgi:Ca-activated chloride channel family protein
VEDLWARRKVGYLLDQIRLNGEKKEITDEVVSLAKKYGITTPYTSYLVAPDTPVVTSAPMPMLGPVPMAAPQSTDMIYSFNSGLIRGNSSGMTPPAGAAAAPGHSFSTAVTATATPPMAGRAQFAPVMTQAPTVGNGVFAQDLSSVTTGRAGVDLSQSLSELRTQSQVATKTVRKAAGRTCTEVNGVWTDEAFNGKQPLLKVKALSNAYFRLLERQPQLREVFQLGQRVIWVTPSGTALVIDPNEGVEELDDARIHVLFTKRHC